MDRIKLMMDLIQLVHEEAKYAVWYETKEAHIIEEDKTAKYAKRWDFWSANRSPNKATTSDALKLISRLARQEANKSKSWYKEDEFND